MRLKMKFSDNGTLKRFAAVEKGAVLTAVKARLRPVVETEEKRMRAAVSANYVRNRKGGDRLQRRSGRLQKAIGSRYSTYKGIGGAGRGFGVQIGVVGGSEKVKRYAMMQIIGGTITPKRSSLLMIPVNSALTDTGEPKFSPREAKREYAEVYFVRERGGGRVFLYGKNGGSSELLFIGVKRVEIPSHPFVTENRQLFLAKVSQEAATAMRKPFGA